MEEDFSLSERPTTIAERKLDFNPATGIWTFSKEKVWNYEGAQKTRKPCRASEDCLNILRQLASGEDLLKENIPTSLPEKIIKVEKEDANEVSRMSSTISSNSSVQLLTEIWEPPKVSLNEMYLVPKPGVKRWVTAKLVEIESSTGMMHLVTEKTFEHLKLTLKEMALTEPTGKIMPVGTRVVARVTATALTGEVGKGPKKHDLGVILEIPSEKNRFRYLIIFDCGLWQYVKSKDLYGILYQSEQIWHVIPEPNCYIVKDFLNELFKPEMEYNKGDPINFEADDHEFQPGTILNVDASLIIIWLLNYNYAVWIHKGSRRLKRRNEKSP